MGFSLKDQFLHRREGIVDRNPGLVFPGIDRKGLELVFGAADLHPSLCIDLIHGHLYGHPPIPSLNRTQGRRNPDDDRLTRFELGMGGLRKNG